VKYIALVAVLAGCSGDSTAQLDSDITHPDADPYVRGTVTVRVVDRNDGPLAGLHVVFIDTDAVVTDVTTDAAGIATAQVFPGASATALRARSNGQEYSLTTVRAIQAGDDITLVSAPPGSGPSEDPFTSRAVPLPALTIASAVKSGSSTTFTTAAPPGLASGKKVIVEGISPAGYNGAWNVNATPSPTTFTVSYSNSTAGSGGTVSKATPFAVTYPSYAGATSYEVHTPCGPTNAGTATTATVYLRTGCSTSTMDIVVYAKSSSTTELAALTRPDVALSAGSTTLSGAWTPVSALTATYSNPTSLVSHVTIARHAPYVRGAPQEFVKQAVGAPITLSTAFPPSAWMRSTLTCETGGPCVTTALGVAQQTYAAKVDGAQTTYTHDIGANLLPWISAAYVPSTTTLDVTVTGSESYDLFEANLKYFRNVGASQVIFTWRVFAPTAEDVTFPALPSTLPGDPTVRTTDTQSSYQAYLCESDAIASYRDAVANPYTALATCESSPVVTTRPPAGTRNRLSSWN